MYNLLFWISIHVALLWTLGNLTATYRDRKSQKIIFFPGLLLAQLLRAIACIVAVKPLEKVEFFADRRPFLVESKSKLGYAGELLHISTLLLGSYLVFRASVLSLGGTVEPYFELPHIDPGELSRGYLLVDARGYGFGVEAWFFSLNWADWKVWAFLVATLSAFPYLAISPRQARDAAVVVVLLAALTWFLNYFGIRPGFLSRAWYVERWILPEHFRIYTLYLTLIGFTIAFHMLVRLAWEGLFRMMKSGVKAKEQHDKQAKSKDSKQRQPQAVH